VIGSTLGPYRVTAKLGEGGMGEVWLAEDTRLERPVALKTLPSELALDPARQDRFEAEAKTASTLNHPNVTHIYEVGETDGVRFIAMEYVEGTDLTEAVRRAPLATEEIARIGVQLADALAEAHEAGIVHRDIKPGNLMLTSRGRLKVLDFGLAKLRPELDGPLDEDAPTQSVTQPGVVVGTVRYMSPEQTLGRSLDARSDLFSAGIVLYELATGRAPFLGSTSTETIVKITRDQPQPVRELNAEVPTELDRIIRKCLEKDPDHRYQNARDLMLDLEALRRDSESGTIRQQTPTPRRSFPTRAVAIGAVIAALAVAGLWFGPGLFADRGETIR
jgi:serine/threonine protein kinase